MNKSEAFWLVVHTAFGDPGTGFFDVDGDGDVRVYQLSQDQCNAVGTLIPPNCSPYWVMDRFCLALPRNDDHLRQETLNGFFRWLGCDYERFIEVPRNLENISVLAGLLPLSPPALIADFGCGSGLAHVGLSPVGYTVVGIDTCPIMRELARARGMRTFSPSDFAATDMVVDGIISSYVLHFGPEESSLSFCWSRMRRGSVFAANVHKAQGLDRTLLQFSHLQGRVLSIGLRAGMERHGVYLQIEKP